MIDTQSLRTKILDLAMRGQLTEQLPEDGTAEELYQIVQTERKRQEIDGTIKQVELAPEITDKEKPFDIPKTWKWTHLGNICYIVRGGSPRPIKEYITTRENGINWIKIGDVEKGGKYIYSTHEKIIPEGESKSRHVYPGDFLLTNSMSFGRPYISKIEGCIHDGWLLIHGLNGFDQDYLYYLLSSKYLYNQFTAKASGSTVENLNIDKVKAAIIPLPPLAEQQRIVDQIQQAFTALDTINELQTQYADNLNVLKSKLIDAAIQGQLTVQLPEDGTAEELYRQIQEEKQALVKAGKIKKEKPLPEIGENEVPFEIPKTWKWVRFSELMLSMSTGPFGSMLHKADYIENGIPLVNPANIVNGSIIPSSKMMVSEETRTRLSSYILRSGMIVMGRRGEMGRCAVVTSKEDGWLCGTGSFFMEPAACLYVEFINSIFSTHYAKGYLGGESIGTTMKNLNHTILSKMPVPLPPLAEQKRIVARLEELLPLCEKLK